MTLQPLTTVLAKEVDRKEFVLYLGLFLLAITGISGIWQRVGNLTQNKPVKGFGSGPYGM